MSRNVYLTLFLVVVLLIGLLFPSIVHMMVQNESFTDFQLMNTPLDYRMGQYDGLRFNPADYSTPEVPLIGPPAGPDDLYIFKNNQCKPECCPASFSCSGGCVCETQAQRDFINMRGGNRGPSGEI